MALTEAMFVGVLSPTSQFADLSSAELKTRIPVTASIGAGRVCILVEAQGYAIKRDATVDLASASGWYTVGCFTDSGLPNAPEWHPNENPSGANPLDWSSDPSNNGIGMWNLDGSVFLAVRVTFFLPAGRAPWTRGRRWTGSASRLLLTNSGTSDQ